MKVFVAGASGALGVQLVPQLVAAGHEVVAMTRTPSKQDLLRRLGARPVVADALDPDAVCPWPCQSPRWWPGKVLAVVSR